MSSSYRIAPPDPEWPRAAGEEVAAVASAAGMARSRVAHIGSTAVPGLGAKPIIDLMLGIPGDPSAGAADWMLESLKAIGYEHKGETVPGTLYLRKAEPRRFNLHLTGHGGEFWERHLLFRDYLRAHPEVAGRYEALKRSILAKMEGRIDVPGYNDRKAAFIASCEKAAEAWRRERDGA